MQNPYSANPYGYGGGTYNYYSPIKTYGSTYGLGGFASTPLGDQYLEDNHEARYTRWLAQNGFRDFTSKGEFGRGEFGKIEDGYKAALGTAPQLKFGTYLDQIGQSLSDQFDRLTPEQRGETPSITAPRARMIPR